jgi:hypothetical protein
MDRQAVAAKTLWQHVQHPTGVPFTGETHDESSSPGEFHPQALTEPDGKLAPHPALHTQPQANRPGSVILDQFLPLRVDLSRIPSGSWLRSAGEFLPLRVAPPTKQGMWAPSLHAHYRHFLATTSPSAPVPRIGTLGLGGHPLEPFPSHRGDRFPGYLLEPESESRHLNAGRHTGSKRISPMLIPEQRLHPGFDVVPTLSTRHQWFTCVRLSDPHLTRSSHAFSLMLTTRALNPSRPRWFAACLRRPAARDLLSSRTDIAWRTVVRISDEEGTSHQPRLDFTLEPHVQHIVQIDVGQQRRNHPSNNLAKCPRWGFQQKGADLPGRPCEPPFDQPPRASPRRE